MKKLTNKILLIVAVCFIPVCVNCQAYFYRVYLKDKGANVTDYNASDLLSEKAIKRRQKSGISFPDYKDIPVNKNYIEQISSAGFELHCTSKWMNTALFMSNNASGANILAGFPFVSEVRIVKTPEIKRKSGNKLDFERVLASADDFDSPLQMLNGNVLHNSGCKGDNILIAVLDGGFINANRIESLFGLYERNGIKYAYDFVENDNFVYESSSHGTAVLSILAGSMPGVIAGTAPDADYMLLKTENPAYEFPCEEDFWAAGAEFADSAGVDIINSSLGYNVFDESTMNYTNSDLDGNTAFITRVADIAVSKGIMVFCSAGNERNNSWRKILVPADGDSVIAVGAVNISKTISNFSSEGPSADNRVKPDFVAMGVTVPVQTYPVETYTSNGTSFSCPVLSGITACLMQAVPEATYSDIVSALKESSDRYQNPDKLYGYGIPDFGKALTTLLNKRVPVPDEDIVAVPNPFTGDFDLIFRQSPGTIEVEIFSITGKLISKTIYPDYLGRSLNIDQIQNMGQGIYILKIVTKESKWVKKVIKMGL
ncbi:MAG TPA: S8 family peptidase [Bacteroidales bacterium]|nr:S8 family peptidase [Bacteroidales bacterium]